MQTYTQAVEGVCREVQQVSIITPQYYYQYAAFSANLGLFIPQISIKQHPKLFRKALLNQWLANLDEYYRSQLHIHWVSGKELDFDQLRDSPGIVCTYHTGSYRLLSYLLLEQRIPIALLLASKVIDEQGEAMIACAKEGNGNTLFQ